MRVFFDNCTSPVLASTLHGFLRTGPNDAVHIMDLPCGRDAKDVDWIAFLAATGDDWLVITGDLRISKNKAERQAFRQARLKGIVLAPAYQGLKMNQQASFLLWRWPDVDAIVRLTAPPFLFELPAQRSSRLRQLSL